MSKKSANSIHEQIVEFGDRNSTNLDEYLNVYEGYLSDKPDSSIVKGMIIDDSFYGTIQSKTDGKFFLEPAKKYKQTNDGIIYHENDLNLDHSYFQKIFSSGILGESFTLKPTFSNFQPTDCGSEKKSNHDLLSTEIDAETTTVCLTLAIKVHNILSFLIKLIYKKNKAEFEEDEKQNSRRSNSFIEPKQLTFPDNRSVCDLYLKVDPFLYEHVFNNEGDKVRISYFHFFFTKK